MIVDRVESRTDGHCAFSDGNLLFDRLEEIEKPSSNTARPSFRGPALSDVAIVFDDEGEDVVIVNDLYGRC